MYQQQRQAVVQADLPSMLCTVEFVKQAVTKKTAQATYMPIRGPTPV